MAGNTTLLSPPADDPSKSTIENLLEITDLSIIEPNVFTNTRPLWQPPGARGIYGGAVVAQCLAAAYKTVHTNFDVHSLHCYFLLAGDSKFPFIYYVERIRDGRSFATRTVHAKQHGKCIFTTSISFVRENSDGKNVLQHALPLPDGIKKPSDNFSLDKNFSSIDPVIICHETADDQHDKKIYEKKVKHWMKAEGVISEAGGHQAHIIALAYISDCHFLRTVGVIHDYYKFPKKKDKRPDKKSNDAENPAKFSQDKIDLKNEAVDYKSASKVGMIVSLDHTIYFHEPRKFKADEWMLFDMSSPWSGQGRGVVMQHVFTENGTLIATCHQEGILRLNQTNNSKDSKL
ncbi:Acyl-coenzyme A thioesterase 8 [Erysiphe neolycopersici]|uniref:Acyl-coenzyme A thioesterase 8 n=1 Tax=Erysiphe neolycopersici TaxID=212602 RepID=A0A420HEL5_9PEZI|nr:Acyl-coenzyme A thioesterase 8 [Erysiphe neolycopersici]